MANLLPHMKVVRLVATDFDGVHTNGFVFVDQNGIESVRVSRKDGLAFDMLKKASIDACIISKEANPVVAARAAKLRIPCHQAVATGEGKREILERITHELRLSPGNVLYMGNDLNDIEALTWAGVPACPADSHSKVLALVRSRGGYVAKQNGGDAVIREVVETILEAKGLPLAF